MQKLNDHELDQVSGGVARALVPVIAAGIMYDFGKTLFFRAGGHLQYYMNALEGAAVGAKYRLMDMAFRHQYRA